MKTIKVTANKTIRYSKKTYVKDEVLSVKESELVEMLSAGNVSKIPGINYEEEKIDSAPEVIEIPISFKELSEMTHEELNGIDSTLDIKTEGNKPERVSTIWAKLSEGYEAKADEEL